MTDTTHPLAAADAAAESQDAQRGVDDASTPCPLPDLAVVEVLVVGSDDQPVPDVAAELLRAGGESLRARTDRRGTARFEGLEEGTYELSLYDLDRDAWSVLDDASLSADAAKSSCIASWQAHPAQQEADRTVEVKQGESVSTISQAYGCFPETLWNAPQNKTLRGQREDPNVLLPGDQVVVPARRVATVPVKTGARHRVRRRGVSEILRICFLDDASKPRKDVPYLCKIENARGQALATYEGHTDGEGILQEWVPLDATSARIRLDPGTSGEEVFVLRIGTVDPIDTLTGIQARLNSLGYDTGEPDGRLEAPTRDALKRFQRTHGVAESGEPDDVTIDALREAYRA